MEFSRELYVDEPLKDRMESLKEKLNNNQWVPFIHVLTLPITKDGLLEIYPAYVLKQKWYQSRTIKVVGIASGREEAFSLVERIIQDCMKQCHNLDIANYFEF